MPSRDTSALHAPVFRRRLGWLTLVLFVYVSWEALSPTAKGLGLQHLDKLLHLLAFATLALTSALSLPARRSMTWAVTLGLMAYGGLIEILQIFIPGREASWADFAADLVGIAAGLAMANLLRRLASRK